MIQSRPLAARTALLPQVLGDRPLADALASADGETLPEVARALLAEHPDLDATEERARALADEVLAAASRELAGGEPEDHCFDPRVLAALDAGHQLLAWRTRRDAWLAAHHTSLDGMYLSRRVAAELPGYELTSSAYCQSTRREPPPELAAEAARVGGEVRWYAPERRLVAAVKFPPAFRHTEHARWCIRRERARQSSRETLHRRGLDATRWQDFLDATLEKLRAALEISAAQIQRHGAVVELHIDVIDDDTSGEGTPAPDRRDR